MIFSNLTRLMLPLCLVALAMLSANQTAAQNIRSERVAFAPGSSGAVINGRIVGSEIVDYVVGVSAGQRMVVDLSASSSSANFNITGPGAMAAVHIGASEGAHFDGILPSGGDWVIRVYLLGNARDQNLPVTFTLSTHIGGAAHTPLSSDYVDSQAGGPDFWQVTGASTLNVRNGPSTNNAVIARASAGQTLRNLGCQGSGDARWCHVESANGLVAGWVAGRFLKETGAPGNIATAPREPEFSVDSMGPDFWEVAGVTYGDSLNLRAGPSTKYSILARAQNGQIFRNLGCRGLGEGRWCHVQTADGRYDGWVSGAYLREGGAAPATGTAITVPSKSPNGPDVHARPTGEIEVRWSSGCVVLFNPAGQRINAGSSCAQSQLRGSEIVVSRYR